MLRIFFLFALTCLMSSHATGQELQVLFLGDNGPHKPRERFDQLHPVMAKRDIVLTYTDQVSDLNIKTLSQYQVLILYANIDTIEPEQAQALLQYVRSGHGFVPIHCATYCFRNSPEVIALMGAQFQRHGSGVLTAESSGEDHPITKGYRSFSSWDESYVHHKHNEDSRTVLEYRHGGMQAEGRQREPWTWVRTEGQGRVFYTAWGHDHRTWGNPGFHSLIERGIRWASGSDAPQSADRNQESEFPIPEMTPRQRDVKPFEYVDVGNKIPNYQPSGDWGAQGAPITQMQKPLEPSESIKHMVVPKGFRVEVFADESHFSGKPIAMNWDHLGRLWVCESVDYPNQLDQDNKGRDRVRILIDSDGDGRADRSTIFAENLSIPAAIAFHRGGAVVQNGTETLYLKDTNGDDKADVRHVLISGWNMNDTHGGVSNFRNGLDNWIWAMQGYNDSAPIINGVRQQPFRMGFFRFKLSQTDPPTVEQIEFVRSTQGNTWGLGISEEGLIFGSTANRLPSFFMPIPNRYYERVRGWGPDGLQAISDTHLFKPITDKVRQVDHHGGYTAATGHAIYSARKYPKAWWNRVAFVCGPTGKLVGTFVLTEDGAGFQSSNLFNLLASDDEWTAPIMAEVGPDGNVWVIDWYNYIIQHNPTPHGFETGQGQAYVTDLRDKKYGRIYRAVYEGEDSKDDSDSNATGKVQQLRDPTMLVRLSAQRLLIEQGETACVPELLGLIADQSVDAIGLNVGAIHALHTLKGLGVLESTHGPVFDAVVAALSHPSAGVRLNAIRVLPPGSASLNAVRDKRLLYDSEAQVVLAALLALSDMSTDDAGAVIAEAVATTRINSDPWLRDAATSAASMHGQSFLLHYLAKNSIELSLPIARQVSEHLARSKLDASYVRQLVSALTSQREDVIAAVVDGLHAGWPDNYSLKLKQSANNDLRKLFSRANNSTKSTLVQLVRTWKSNALAGELEKVAELLIDEVMDETTDVANRIVAAKKLIEFDPQRQESVDVLCELINPQSPPELSLGLVGVVVTSQVDDLSSRLLEKIKAATPSIRESIVREMLRRPALTPSLLDGIESNVLSLFDLTPLQRQNLSEHPDPLVRHTARELIQRGGATVDSNRAQAVASKMSLTKKTGNAGAGKLIFTKNCANCHVFKGEGKTVGPSLNGMSVHPKSELLTHILDPSRSVEANYRQYKVLTLDGVMISGLLAAESRTTVEIIDAQAKRHTILREDIDQLQPSAKSAMPEGLETSINEQGLVDLLEYLTQKGRFLPLALEKAATTVTTVGMFYSRQTRHERLVFDDWGQKKVDGIPFDLIDPRGSSVNNAIMLHSSQGTFAPRMPKSIKLRCDASAQAIHLLGGVAGWGAQKPGRGGVAMIVRLRYTDGTTEDHRLVDGQHIADYISRFDVPKSKHAFNLDGRQLRLVTLRPKRSDVIEMIELVKPEHAAAPIVMAITLEFADSSLDLK